MIKVFLDNCIFSVSETLQYQISQKTLKWGNQVLTNDILGYARKPLPDDNSQWKRNQIMCIPTIVNLVYENKLQFFSYNEVKFEGWKKILLEEKGYLLKNVTIEFIEPAIDRSYFQSMDFFEFIDNKNVIDFCKFLLSLNNADIKNLVRNTSNYPNLTKKSINNIERFKEICSGLSDKQLPDAFHLWSAEVNGLDYFLTIDKRFINTMNITKKINLNCLPISPEKLLEKLKVKECILMEFQKNKFIQ
ncbi:hypothetical protein [Arcobacter arenosus]|uniref:hypothetical protein n=1 Tax=Arcobacter arenosus TaxID=2576037 RepID=UPI003BAC7EC3